jgi:hypothetical protein
MKNMYDFIGDIHGHADALVRLLEKLGYENTKGYYSHLTRKVIFVGDYIDRGPKIRETLAIVKGMADHDQALALLGNHEFNAILFHLEDQQGGHLRQHRIKNIMQHYETLQQFQNKQQEYDDYIAWFMTLPLFWETPDFRVVHACWDDSHIAYLSGILQHGKLTREAIVASCAGDTRLAQALDETLKGKELKMPDGLFFLDKDGNHRTEMRIKWWDNPAGLTFKKYCVEHLEEPLLDQEIHQDQHQDLSYYQHKEKPVFFGHYWLKGTPALYRHNVCCLDYSVAKGGDLVAYRWNGEQELHAENLVYV